MYKSQNPKLDLLLVLFVLSLAFSCSDKQNLEIERSASPRSSQASILSLSQKEFDALHNDYKKTKKTYAGEYGSLFSLAASVGSNSDVGLDSDILTHQEALSEVLSDPFVESVLNQNGEIIVDNALHKVTVFGTFITDPANADRLRELVSKLEGNYPIADIDFDDLDFDLVNYDVSQRSQLGLSNADLNMLDEIIFYIPTFANDEISIQNNLVGGQIGNLPPIDFTTFPQYKALFGDDGLQPYGGILPGTLPNQLLGEEKIIPSNIPPPREVTESWEKQFPEVNTELNHPMFADQNMFTGNMVNPNGSIWKTIFKKQALYNKFDSKYRTSVNFYNRNFGFWKSIGLTVKHQKKGLILWKKEKTNAIAAGWEGIVYGTPVAEAWTRYYATYIKGGVLYPSNLPPQNPNLMFQLPEQLDLWKISTNQGDYFAPLILSNGFPVPENVRVGGVNKIIQYLWGLVLKKIKDGETTIRENNLVKTYDAVANMKKGIVFKEPGKQDFYLFLPPYFQIAYNTDMIDIPLDSYNADLKVGLNLIAGMVSQPSQNVKALSNWVRIEFKQTFTMKQAVVYGSSQRGNTWRGVRVIHN